MRPLQLQRLWAAHDLAGPNACALPVPVDSDSIFVKKVGISQRSLGHQFGSIMDNVEVSGIATCGGGNRKTASDIAFESSFWREEPRNQALKFSKRSWPHHQVGYLGRAEERAGVWHAV